MRCPRAAGLHPDPARPVADVRGTRDCNDEWNRRAISLRGDRRENYLKVAIIELDRVLWVTDGCGEVAATRLGDERAYRNGVVHHHGGTWGAMGGGDHDLRGARVQRYLLQSVRHDDSHGR